jgi:hypothetical protein
MEQRPRNYRRMRRLLSLRLYQRNRVIFLLKHRLNAGSFKNFPAPTVRSYFN